MIIRPLAIIIIILAISINPTFGQDSLKTKKIKILPVPTIGYSPETKTYFGAVSLFTLNFYQDSLTRTSNASVEFNYTMNKQLIVETDWNYFFRAEAWFTRGVISFSKYPDLYYGIGANTPESNELKFESNRFVFDVDGLNNLWNNLFAGAGIRYINYSNLDFYENSNPYRELKGGDTFGLKLIILNDSRNNILNASAGNYMEIVNSYNFSNVGFYSIVGLDLRKYITPKYNEKHVFAGRLFTSMVLGDPPFYDYSIIGGDQFSRGYFFGRFRDLNMTTLQLEYRLNLFWRLGLAAFGGTSLICDDYTNINSNSFKPNGGLGLRFLVDKAENTNLRIDYAIGAEGQDGFYISFGESF
jgi:hypothetical protein